MKGLDKRLDMSVSVLFVCLGNICRSPTADGIFRHHLQKADWHKRVRVDSAGTSDWHIGRAPDPRTVAAAHKRGYDLSALRGRQVTAADFNDFDYVLAMDKANLADLQTLAPADYRGHLGLFLAFATQQTLDEVPDPYYGEGDGFERVLDLIEDACAGLLRHIQLHHSESSSASVDFSS